MKPLLVRLTGNKHNHTPVWPLACFVRRQSSGRKPLERVANETTPSLAVPSLTEVLAVIRRGDDVASEYASRGARVPNVSFKGQSSRDQTRMFVGVLVRSCVFCRCCGRCGLDGKR